MKFFGILILLAGLALSVFALNMRSMSTWRPGTSATEFALQL
jgi:hypothetical protein